MVILCLIVIKKDFAFAAVDKIRSIPIIYTVHKKQLILSDWGTGISEIVKLKLKDIDFFPVNFLLYQDIVLIKIHYIKILSKLIQEVF